jgi:hypothetical protein
MIQRDSQLERIIRDAGEGWILEWTPPRSGAINYIQQLIQSTEERGKERFGQNAPEISENTIVAEYNANPEKIRAFLQALGSTQSADILLMVWRILEGMEIEDIKMEYSAQKSFNLQIRLVSPDSGSREEYRSEDIDDAAMLRHLGILKMGGKPVFDGFYPLRLQT